MKRWRLPLIAAAIVIVGVAASVAVVRAQVASAHHRAGAPAARAKQLRDPAARQAMQRLHERHAADVRAWKDEFGADSTKATARRALSELSQRHGVDMRALFEKHGVKGAALCDQDVMGGAGSSMLDMMDGAGSSMMDDDPVGMMGVGSGTGTGMMSSGSVGMMGARSRSGGVMSADDATDVHDQHHGGDPDGDSGGIR